jgi:geranylgeranyl pyrophosphate synthase
MPPVDLSNYFRLDDIEDSSQLRRGKPGTEPLLFNFSD